MLRGPGSRGQALEVHLSAAEEGGGDGGGTIDGTAQKGMVYRYTAQRVRSVTVDGVTVESRSERSAEVEVKVVNTFPPEAPTGLEAAAGGEGRAGYRPFLASGAGG